jgi:FkbM family methyltransferase
MGRGAKQTVKNWMVSALVATPRLRKGLVRISDLVSRLARLDLSNDMEVNGEFVVQEAFLNGVPKTGKLVVFDVGSNVGHWTRSLLARAQRLGRGDVEVHMFEPCRSTFALLQDNLKSWELGGNVRAINQALSSTAGTAELNVVGDGIGANSLHGGIQYSRTEKIDLVRLDDYCREAGIGPISFLKLDVEGHEMSVLEGASEKLRRGDIGLIQFEYNYRWVFPRRFLKDAFDLLCPLGYSIGKVIPRGIELYDGWDWRLESFREGNYLACRADWVHHFPTIRWWGRK